MHFASAKKTALDILVLSDLHYTGPDNPASPLSERRSDLGPVLLEKSLQRLRHKGVSVDLMIVLGDKKERKSEGAGSGLD